MERLIFQPPFGAAVSKETRQTVWSASILLIFRFLAVFAPTEGRAMIALAELVVEEAGVLIAHGDDDITDGQVCLLQKSDRLAEALLLQKAAKRRATKLAYTLGKVGNTEPQLVRKLTECRGAEIGA